jgi:hypothetical protein
MNGASVMSGAKTTTVKSLLGRSSKKFKNKKPLYGANKKGGK